MADTDIVTRLAREAGARYLPGPGDEPTDGYLAFEDISSVGPPDYPALRRFAALVAEECAKVCEAQAEEFGIQGEGGCETGASSAAAAIRERFTKP